MNRTITRTFKKGNATFFYLSKFFPRDVRDNVYILYCFVKKAGSFADAQPEDAEGFYSFRESYRKSLEGSESGDVIIDQFAELVRNQPIDPMLVHPILESAEMDMGKPVLSTLDETMNYMYGSSEVIGLIMAAILRLSKESHTYAKALGRAMQYINFIRDIQKDLDLGRTYLPLNGSGLQTLEKREAAQKRELFTRFIRRQIDRYREWQLNAEMGYSYIPREYLVPIKTAADMYKWTAEVIYSDPLIVYNRQVKPSKLKIILTLAKNRKKLR